MLSLLNGDDVDSLQDSGADASDEDTVRVFSASNTQSHVDNNVFMFRFPNFFARQDQTMFAPIESMKFRRMTRLLQAVIATEHRSRLFLVLTKTQQALRKRKKRSGSARAAKKNRAARGRHRPSKQNRRVALPLLW
jgi:hypothetical protein